MTRLFINSVLLSILGECNIYYYNHKYILLYLGLENTTLSNQNFILNKKNHTLIFWSGNRGNCGNRANKALKLQQSLVPTFGVFGSHSSHFPFCPKSSKHCFLRIFSPNLDWSVISFSNRRWTLKFEQSNFSSTVTLRRILFFATLDLFFENINKPPGSRRNEYFYFFLYFFLKEIEND